MSNKSQYSVFLETAVEAARAAGAIQRERLHSRHEIKHKGESDLVTEVDIMCENRVREIILSRHPDHAFLAEESGGSLGADNRWIVDPLDGTTNYAHAYPFFCASVALEQGGKVVAGAVYNPMADEMFTATRGGGACLNGKPIHVSSVGQLVGAMLTTGFPYDKESRMGKSLKLFGKMLSHAQAIRRDGAAALDICFVAAGRFDGFWELSLHPWDLAAGWLIAEEAGGRVTRLTGAPMIIDSPDIVASNSLLHEDIITVLNGQ